jgi:hypothetical protein
MDAWTDSLATWYMQEHLSLRASFLAFQSDSLQMKSSLTTLLPFSGDSGYPMRALQMTRQTL